LASQFCAEKTGPARNQYLHAYFLVNGLTEAAAYCFKLKLSKTPKVFYASKEQQACIGIQFGIESKRNGLL
jgi:hypothetical protein